jgi:hypothetical protein
VEATVEDQKLGVKMSAQRSQKSEQGRLRAMAANVTGVPCREGIPSPYIVCTPTVHLPKVTLAITNAPMATSPINHHHNGKIQMGQGETQPQHPKHHAGTTARNVNLRRKVAETSLEFTARRIRPRSLKVGTVGGLTPPATEVT